jgi:hypothetical protein
VITDYHRKPPSPKKLDYVFRLETERVISNDGVVRYWNRLLQVKNQGRRTTPPQPKVMGAAWEDGRLDIRYRGQAVAWEEIWEHPKPAVKAAKPIAPTTSTELAQGRSSMAQTVSKSAFLCGSTDWHAPRASKKRTSLMS